MQDLRRIQSGQYGIVFGGGDARGEATERRLRPPPQQNLKCPRCDSVNTKFCYYNNYNISQPRHFCKSCRRYWTKGGVLRNVPVGGGCRKTKRSSSSSSSPSSSRTLKTGKTAGVKDSCGGAEAPPPAIATGGDAETRSLQFQASRTAPVGNVAEQIMHVEPPPPPANAAAAQPVDWQASWLFEDQGGLWNQGHLGEMDPFPFWS